MKAVKVAANHTGTRRSGPDCARTAPMNTQMESHMSNAILPTTSTTDLTDATASTKVAPSQQDVAAAMIDPVVVLGVAVAVLRSLDFPRDIIVESIHNAFLVDVPEQVTADVLDAVRRGANEIQVRQPAPVDVSHLADTYRPMTHPEDYCHPPFCLAEVEIDDVTGRAWHNRGVHRREVRSLEIAYGVLAQVGIGVADDFELIIDEPFVHAWIADTDGNDDDAYELQLSADEAERLGSFFTSAARNLRDAQWRRAKEYAQGVADAIRGSDL